MRTGNGNITGGQLQHQVGAGHQNVIIQSSANLLGVVHFQVLLHQLLHSCTPGNHGLVHYLQHSIKDELQRDHTGTKPSPQLRLSWKRVVLHTAGTRRLRAVHLSAEACISCYGQH